MVFLLSKSYSEEMNTWQTKNAKKHRSFPCFLQGTENSPQNNQKESFPQNFRNKIYISRKCPKTFPFFQENPPTKPEQVQRQTPAAALFRRTWRLFRQPKGWGIFILNHLLLRQPIVAMNASNMIEYIDRDKSLKPIVIYQR